MAGARVPRCYHAEVSDHGADFILLMEDMGPARMIDQLAGCSADQAALVVEQAAALHGSSWGHATIADQEWLPVQSV